MVLGEEIGANALRRNILVDVRFRTDSTKGRGEAVVVLRRRKGARHLAQDDAATDGVADLRDALPRSRRIDMSLLVPRRLRVMGLLSLFVVFGIAGFKAQAVPPSTKDPVADGSNILCPPQLNRRSTEQVL